MSDLDHLKSPAISHLFNSSYTSSIEQAENDEVFNNYDLPTFHMPTCNQDSTYKKPDKEQYIFSTMGNKLYTMYSNNMILPIRPKDKLKFSYLLNNRLLSKEDKKEGRGVYIIDYYRISSMVAFDPNFLQNLISYYQTSESIYPNKIEIQDQIQTMLLTNKTKDAFKLPHTVLRVVTFVPEREIQKHQYVFIPTSDIVIGYGYIDSKMLHPNSPIAKEKNRVTTSTVKNFIEIDIVDTVNGSNRYIKVGNKLISLKASRDSSREDKGTMTVYKDNIPMETYTEGLEDLENTLGIYKTEEEAMANGDIASQLNIKKLDLEKEKYERDLEKLKIEYDKLRLSKELLEKEHEHALRKLASEKVILEMKTYVTVRQQMIDIQRKTFEMECAMDSYRIKKEYDIHKYKLDMAYLEEELDMLRVKHKLDMELHKQKSEHVEHNNLLTFGRELLTTTSMLGKLFI